MTNWLAWSMTKGWSHHSIEKRSIVYAYLVFFCSQTEVSDVEIIEIEHEDADLANEHGIIVVSDSESYDDDDNDQEVDIADEIPRSVSIENTDIEIVHEVTVDEDDDDESLEIVVDIINNEIIDLTDDEPNSANPFERKLSTDVQQCPICLETLSDLQQAGVYLIITRCRHVMCTLCCRQLLTTSSRCPLCRENVSTTTLIPYCILT